MPYVTCDSVIQELLLRRCVAALRSWHRIAAVESWRTGMLVDHMRKQHALQLVRAVIRAWHRDSELASAQSSFIIQSLPVYERAVLTAAVRGWRGRCQLRSRASVFR